MKLCCRIALRDFPHLCEKNRGCPICHVGFLNITTLGEEE